MEGREMEMEPCGEGRVRAHELKEEMARRIRRGSLTWRCGDRNQRLGSQAPISLLLAFAVRYV